MENTEDTWLAMHQIIGSGEHACEDTPRFREAGKILRDLVTRWKRDIDNVERTVKLSKIHRELRAERQGHNNG